MRPGPRGGFVSRSARRDAACSQDLHTQASRGRSSGRPDRFGSIQDARAHGQAFFAWYNTEHHHSGLGLLTPHDVHFGLAEQRVAERAGVLATAYAAHPERFPAGCPAPAAAPTEVWINPPKPRALEEAGSAPG